MDAISSEPNTYRHFDTTVEGSTQHGERSVKLSRFSVGEQGSISQQMRNAAFDVESGFVSSLYGALLPVFSFCQARSRKFLQDTSHATLQNARQDSSHALPGAETSSGKGQHVQAQPSNVVPMSGREDEGITVPQFKMLTSVFSRIVLWGDAIQSGKVEATVIHAPQLFKSSTELLADCGRELLRLADLLSENDDESAPEHPDVALLASLLERVERIVGPGVRTQQLPDGRIIDTLVNFSRTPEIGLLLESLDNNAQLLLDLLPSIEHVREANELATSSATETMINPEIASFTRQIALKYCNASQPLIERLGKANWQRFHRLGMMKVAHIYRDLRPYVCLQDSCRAQPATFATRSAWIDHEMEHRKHIVYGCRDCDTLEMTNVEFEEHITHRHADLNNFQRPVFKVAASRVRSFSPDRWVCCLCQDTNFSSVERYTSHVCRHLEDIASDMLPDGLHDLADNAVGMPVSADGEVFDRAVVPQALVMSTSASESATSEETKPTVKLSRSESEMGQMEVRPKECLTEVKQEAEVEDQAILGDDQKIHNAAHQAKFEKMYPRSAHKFEQEQKMAGGWHSMLPKSSRDLDELLRHNRGPTTVEDQATAHTLFKTEAWNTETQGMVEKIAKSMTPAQAIYLVTQNETLRRIISAIVETSIKHIQGQKDQAQNELVSIKDNRSPQDQPASPEQRSENRLLWENTKLLSQHDEESVRSWETLERSVPESSTTKNSDCKKWLKCDHQFGTEDGIKHCPASFASSSELRKHKRRHEKRFGCTVDGCYLKFGTKWEWKRHEQSQHIKVEGWHCRDVHGDDCQRLYKDVEEFEVHFRSHLDDPDSEVLYTGLERCRLARRWNYWCGFCRDVISPQKDYGRDMDDERIEHVSEHYANGSQYLDWIELDGRGMTKGEMKAVHQLSHQETASDC